MADIKENKGLRGFLKSLIADEESPQEEQKKPEAAIEEKVVEQKVEEEKKRAEPVYHTITGSVLALWNSWAGQRMPPRVSLTADLNTEGLDLQKLEQDWARLGLQMELEAKKRLKLIQTEESKARTKAQNEENSRRAKARAEGGNEDKIFVVPEPVNLDAECLAFISRDKLVAWLMVLPPCGSGVFRMEDVGKVLQAHQVSSGMDTAKVMSLAKEVPYFQLIPIAVGTPAVEGTNGSIVEHFSRTQEFRVKITEDGIADYKSSNYVRQVFKDTVICDIIPPVEGTPGLSVDGKVIQPKPVRPAKVPKGRNTTITEDGLQLVSTMDGHLEFKGEGFQVRPVMEIEGDVDYEIGNINFTGDVHVKGDVRENFSVVATGSVTIDGLVEAATVEAGGDLVITKGVVGDNRALIKAQGDVRSKYLESCVTYAGKCVYTDCIMNSQVYSDGCIDVTSGRGSVVGGTLVAAAGIRAKMIGAESGRKTELIMGVLPVVQTELGDLTNELQANREEDEELVRQLSFLEARQGMQGSDPRIAKARMRRSVLAMKEQQIAKRIEYLEEQRPDLSKCRLEADTVYPVTTLQVGNATWSAKQNLVHCRVQYSEQERCLKEVL